MVTNHRLSRVVLVFRSSQLALQTTVYTMFDLSILMQLMCILHTPVFSVSELCCNGVCPFVRIFGEFRKISQFTQFRTLISHPFFANYPFAISRFAFRRLLIVELANASWPEAIPGPYPKGRAPGAPCFLNSWICRCILR